MAKRTWPSVRQRKGRGDWCIDLGRVEVVLPDGTTTMKRRQLFRTTKKLAEDEARTLRDRRNKLGLYGLRLKHSQVIDALEALKLLEGRYSLKHAAQFLVERKPQAQAVTVKQVYDRLIQSLVRREQDQEVGHRHVSTTRSTLRQFVQDYANTQVADLTREMMKKWVHDSVTGSTQTRANRIRHINMLFNFAIQEGYLTSNPMKGIRPPKIKHQTPEHHSVEDVRRIMQITAQHAEHREIIPRLAIGYFAGLRAAELDKLTWEDIKFDAGIIAVSEDIAKGNVPRPVKIAPNLMLWIEPYRNETGPVSRSYRVFRDHARAVTQTAQIPWVQNAMRHTFATHHYAYHQSADLTAKELGHMGNYRLLHQNYANAGMTKEEAAAYWTIAPGAPDGLPMSPNHEVPRAS